MCISVFTMIIIDSNARSGSNNAMSRYCLLRPSRMEMMRELSSVGDGIRPYLSRLSYCISPLARIIFVPFLDPESDHNEAEDYISNRPHVRREVGVIRAN